MSVMQPIEILLVEDNPDDVALALHALRSRRIGNRVHVARDGAEALEYLLGNGQYIDQFPSNLPKVILLDLKLPRVDGLTVLKQLRADPRTQYVPIVVMTSSRQEQDLIKSYQLGANGYVIKPIDFDQFADAVQQAGYYWLVVNQPPVVAPG